MSDIVKDCQKLIFGFIWFENHYKTSRIIGNWENWYRTLLVIFFFCFDRLIPIFRLFNVFSSFKSEKNTFLSYWEVICINIQDYWSHSNQYYLRIQVFLFAVALKIILYVISCKGIIDTYVYIHTYIPNLSPVNAAVHHPRYSYKYVIHNRPIGQSMPNCQDNSIRIRPLSDI